MFMLVFSCPPGVRDTGTVDTSTKVQTDHLETADLFADLIRFALTLITIQVCGLKENRSQTNIFATKTSNDKRYSSCVTLLAF